MLAGCGDRGGEGGECDRVGDHGGGEGHGRARVAGIHSPGRAPKCSLFFSLPQVTSGSGSGSAMGALPISHAIGPARRSITRG